MSSCLFINLHTPVLCIFINAALSFLHCYCGSYKYKKNNNNLLFFVILFCAFVIFISFLVTIPH